MCGQQKQGYFSQAANTCLQAHSFQCLGIALLLALGPSHQSTNLSAPLDGPGCIHLLLIWGITAEWHGEGPLDLQ